MQNQISKTWQKVKLGNIGKVITGNTPPTPQKDLFGLDYPFITPTDIKDFDVRYNYLTERFVSEKWMARKKNLSLPKNSTCFVCIGSTIGKMCLVKETSFTNQQINTIISDPTKSDPLFIYYLLKNNQKDILKEFGGGGAAKPIINKSTFEGIEVEFPEDILEQEKIASMLSAFDDKIEVNNKIAKTLEEMARALFKEWFITNASPDWEKSKFENYAKLEYGKALQEEKRIPGKVLVFGSSGQVGTHKEKLCSGPGIVVGRKGNVGSVFWIDDDFYTIDTTFYVNSKISLYYVYFVLKNMRFHTGDSAVPGLNRESVHSFEISIPDEHTLNNFEDIVSSMFKKLAEIKRENQKLAALRDLLLPKLMKGEIRV